MSNTRKLPLMFGMVLFLSFFGVLLLIFSPVFGGKNGLNFADDLFNKLSKGSSDFIPGLLKKNGQQMGTHFQATLVLEKEAEPIMHLCSAAGAKAELNGTTLLLEGDLGKVLQCVLRDAHSVFNGDGSGVVGRYGLDEKKVMENWWVVLTKMEKYFKKNLRVKEANMVSEVVRKAVEPAYNYYEIEAQNVSERAGIMCLLLIFYVGYTIWWGYAILYLFEGLGLSMKKARVKKEIG